MVKRKPYALDSGNDHHGATIIDCGHDHPGIDKACANCGAPVHIYSQEMSGMSDEQVRNLTAFCSGECQDEWNGKLKDGMRAAKLRAKRG